MHKYENRTWWVITIVLAFALPYLFTLGLRYLYYQISPVEVVPILQIAPEEKKSYTLTLFKREQKASCIMIYAIIIFAIIALIMGLFFVRNFFMKVGLIVMAMVCFALAYYHYYIRERIVAPIIQRLEAQKD